MADDQDRNEKQQELDELTVLQDAEEKDLSADEQAGVKDVDSQGLDASDLAGTILTGTTRDDATSTKEEQTGERSISEDIPFAYEGDTELSDGRHEPDSSSETNAEFPQGIDFSTGDIIQPETPSPNIPRSAGSRRISPDVEAPTEQTGENVASTTSSGISLAGEEETVATDTNFESESTSEPTSVTDDDTLSDRDSETATSKNNEEEESEGSVLSKPEPAPTPEPEPD
nr:hypothetical protein [uncultured Pseudodesulfovibrio sp.]